MVTRPRRPAALQARDHAWTLYWADRNSRWHRYDDLDTDRPAQALIDEIEADPTCIFWG